MVNCLTILNTILILNNCLTTSMTRTHKKIKINEVLILIKILKIYLVSTYYPVATVI